MKIATQLLKYVDVNADRAKELAQKLHIKKDELSFIRKFYVSEKSEVNEDERTVTARVSTNDRDRDGEVVDAKGIDFSAYEKNAVLLWSHRYSDPPIGKALWTKSDDSGLVVKFEFAKTQFADEIYQLYKGKFLNAFSIGFIPLDFDTETKTHKKISLLEVSAVPVPANENAIVMEAYQKGMIKSKRLKEDLEIEIEDDDQDVEIEFVVGDGVTKYFILLDNDEYQEISAEDIEAEEKEVEASDNDDTPLGDTMVKIEIPGLDELRAEIAALNERLEKLTTPIDDDPEIDIDPEEKDADIDVDIEDDTPPVPKSVTKEAVKEFIREKGIDVGKILEIALAKMKGKVSLDD